MSRCLGKSDKTLLLVTCIISSKAYIIHPVNKVSHVSIFLRYYSLQVTTHIGNSIGILASDIDHHSWLFIKRYLAISSMYITNHLIWAHTVKEIQWGFSQVTGFLDIQEDIFPCHERTSHQPKVQSPPIMSAKCMQCLYHMMNSDTA